MMKLFFGVLLIMLMIASLLEAIRRHRRLEVEYSAYFHFPDGRKYIVKNQETLIGNAQNADLRIYLPGIKKSGYISGVDSFHGMLIKKQHQFLLRNVSKTEPIIITNSGETTVLEPDKSCELRHDSICVFGNYQLNFYKGVT